MITNVNLIKGVGKFRKCDFGRVTFRDKVLIFGKNTSGKSTFTSILTSLKQDNKDLVLGRKTFGFRENQHIVIKAGGKSYIFQSNEWNESYPDLEVFDTKFIADNVCNNEDISFQQQQKLNAVILGDAGKKKLNQIKTLSEKIKQLGTQKKEITIYLSPPLNEKITIEQFCALKQDKEVDNKIKDKEAEIEQIENKIELLEKVENSFFNYNFDEIRNTMNSEVKIDYTPIKKHMEKHSINTTQGKRVLQEGSKLIKTASCLFCGQDFNQSAKKLVDSYKELFSVKFLRLQKEITESINEFERIDFEDKIKKEKLEFQQLGLTLELDKERISEISKAKINFSKTLSNKKDDLSFNIDFENDENWGKITDKFNEIKLQLIKAKEGLSQKKDIEKIKSELSRLNLTKKRFEEEIVKKLSEYSDLELKTEELKKQREKTTRELESYATGVFQKYKDKINIHLSELNADFKLDDFSRLKKLTGQDESVFTINFDSAPKISPYVHEEHKPGFSNTLSESDKRTLAFAFFLSKLSLDSNLDKKVVVFDDPISSFDKERRRKTKYLLLDVNCEDKKPEQIIVLTHQEDFLKEISREFESSGKEYTVLRINSGKIEQVIDVNKEFPDDEIINKLRHLKELKAAETVEEDFFADCRIILENIMKRKHFEKLSIVLKKDPKASIRTYGQKIYSDEKFLIKFNRLCDDIQIPLHDNSIPEASDGDKKSILKDFFDVLREI